MLICETIARQAGFAVSVGNWISPDGSLISGTDYESHHWETLSKHLGINQELCEKCGNKLSCMNMAIKDGFIRLVFRADVCFQVSAEEVDIIWSEKPNYKTMINVIKKIDEIETHIFSQKFYVIGQGKYIVNREKGKLQIET